MSEPIYDRERATTNTALYVAFLLLSIAGLVTRRTWWNCTFMALLIVWAIGGVTANWRAIRDGFVDLDDPNSKRPAAKTL